MRIINVKQGTPEWHQERAAVITASMFAECCKRVNGLTAQQSKYVEAIRAGCTPDNAAEVAGYKKAPTGEVVRRALDGERVGDFSSTAKAYAMRLAVERISNSPLDEADQFETYAMRRGRELEPEARAIHERKIGNFVMEAGIVLTDDGKFGASADGLIGEDEGAEYKCFTDPTKLDSILLESDITELQHQIQGCMWVTGRKRWHFGLYCPALKSINLDFTLYMVDRDDNFIEKMEEGLLEFDALVEKKRAQLIALGGGGNDEMGDIF